MDLAAWLKEGGLVALSGVLGWWAYILWQRVQALEQLVIGQNERCQLCSQQHAKQVLDVATSAVVAIQQNTEASELWRREHDILQRIEALQANARPQRDPAGGQ